MSSALAHTPLPLEEAFPMAAHRLDAKRLEILWDLPAGYYLYDRFKATSERDDWSVQRYQASSQKQIPEGQEALYRGRVRLEIALGQTSPGEGELTVAFQGCTDAGFCYPPAARQVWLQISERQGLVQVMIPTSTKPVNQVVPVPENDAFQGTVWMYFLAGLLLAFTPCSLPMIPILSSIIVGQQSGGAGRDFRLSLAYVLGMSMTYALIGMLSGYLGGYLALILREPVWLVVMTIILLGLTWSLVGRIHWGLPAFWSHLWDRVNRMLPGGQYGSVFFMGSLATLALSPCITPPLIAAISYIGHTGDYLQGGWSLFCMGLGMGVPLLLVGASLQHWLPKSGVWMRSVNELMAIVMLAVVISLWQGQLSGVLSQILWSLWWLIFAGCFWRFAYQAYGFKRKVWSILGVLILVGGLFWQHQAWWYSKSPSHNTVYVEDLTALEARLQEARLHRQRVFIDYTAKWCANCRWFDAQVLPQTEVQQALKSWVVIKADVTVQNHESQSLMNRFHVIAPPTYIWLDEQGELAHRVVGKLSAKSLLTWLK